MTQEEKEFIIFEFRDDFDKEVKWLFERRTIDGLFPVYFMLYSHHHGFQVFDEETGDFIYKPGKDSLQDRLYDAARMTFAGDEAQFEYLGGLYDLLSGLPKRLFNEVYTFLLDTTLCMTDLVGGTQLQPNSRIALTMANILREHGCQTIWGAYSGIGIYALACHGMKFTGQEPYAPANLIAEVLCDGFGVKKTEYIFADPISEWTRRKFDGVIGNLPVDADFFNEYRADHLMSQFNEMQDCFIKKLITKKTARKVATVLVHFEFANKPDYDETRKLICEKGLLETVIALPEDIFRDALVPTYLLILDMEGGHTAAEFIDATSSSRRQSAITHTYKNNLFDVRDCVKENERIMVGYDSIERCSWAFNPAVYIQNAVCREGQELVPLRDLVTISCGEMVKGERFIDYSSLSHEFNRVAAGIMPGASTEGESQHVEGPSVLIALSVATRRHPQKLICGICREHGSYGVTFFLPVLKPNPERILPDYLALALMTDPTLVKYLKSIQEYYTDDIRSSHILERRIPIYTDLAMQKAAVMDALGRADMAEVSYNVVVAGAGENIARYRSALSKYGCVLLSSAETVEGPNGLEHLLSELSRENTPVSKKADAVIVVSDISLNGKKDEKAFAGLDAVLDLSLLYRKSGLSFFVSSKHNLDEIRNAGIISSRRLKPIESGHFFTTDEQGHPTEALAASVREELDHAMSPESRIRTRHRTAFEAAQWLDETYALKDIRATETISEFLMAAEEGVDTSRNLSDLRNIAHRIIEILKDCRAVPPIDNGAIPHLLYDKKFENIKDGKTYIQDVQIMRRPLSSSLISLIDIGNEGTHTFRTSANLGSAMLQTLLEFVTWIYDNRDEFSVVLTNYWHIDSEYEHNWEETSAPAKRRWVAGKEYWTSGDVHLFVPNGTDLKEGDIVTVRGRKEDTGKTKVEGVKYFAYPKGYNNKYPDGYSIDRSGRDSSES